MWCGVRRLHQQATRHVVWDKETTSVGYQTLVNHVVWDKETTSAGYQTCGVG